MLKENNENLELKNYLLGSSQNGEQEQIEERLMTDDAFFEEFLAAEEDLIQNYVDGDLTDDEKKQFEMHFLISKERQKKLQFAQTLRRNLDTRLAKKNTEKIPEKKFETKSSPNFFQRLFASPLTNPVPAFLVILVFIGIIGITVFFYSSGNQMTPLEKEFAELNRDDFSNLGKYENIPNLSLIPGITRDSANAKKLSKDNLKGKVFFRLALPNQLNSGGIFKIEVLKSQKTVFTQNQIPAYKNQDGEELRFFIPASILEKGNYQIKAENEEIPELSYSFSVE